MYKYELHAHASEVSSCARVPAAQMAEAYMSAGFKAIVVTDHLSTKRAEKFNTWDEYITNFISGYELAKEHGKSQINVFLGMEASFDENANEYLVYGVTEKFLRNNPFFTKMSLKEFKPVLEENGMLLYQAHPFRKNMTIVPVELLYGIEVVNANPRHDSRNDIAIKWAEKFNLKQIAGSDYHQKEDVCKAGICSEVLINSQSILLDVLKSDKYSVFGMENQ